jgi:hypothetical protein
MKTFLKNHVKRILQRTTKTAQVLYRGPKPVGRNQLINSGMPPNGGPLAWPQACICSIRNWLQGKTLTRRSF